MAKRSKKKNPNLLSEKQRADLRHNQELDEKKRKLDLKLNITLGIVIAFSCSKYEFYGFAKRILGRFNPR